MKHIAPHGSEIYKFGPNLRDKGVFKGKLLDALPILAKKMGMTLKPSWEKNFGAAGDGKLDLVAIFSLDPFAPSFVVIVGQCASMENENDWQTKRSQAQLSYQAGTYDYLVEPQGVLFIPVCFRQPDGDWVNSNSVSAVISLDRLRILLAIKDDSNLDELVSSLFQRARISLPPQSPTFST
jgi:hypothetical protein